MFDGRVRKLLFSATLTTQATHILQHFVTAQMFTAPQHKSLWLQHHNNSDPPYEILEDELIDIENRKEQEKEDNNTPVKNGLFWMEMLIQNG